MSAKPLVKVLWEDAQDHPQKWVDEKDAECFGEEVCEIVSVGFLISKGPKNIVLGADWDRIDKDYGRVTKIPTGWVKSITELS